MFFYYIMLQLWFFALRRFPKYKWCKYCSTKIVGWWDISNDHWQEWFSLLLTLPTVGPSHLPARGAAVELGHGYNRATDCLHLHELLLLPTLFRIFFCRKTSCRYERKLPPPLAEKIRKTTFDGSLRTYKYSSFKLCDDLLVTSGCKDINQRAG